MPDSKELMGSPNKQITIKAADDDLKSRYSNSLQISHSKEHFSLDFFYVQEPVGQLVSRLVVSPGHAKRILNALTENISKYEANFGPIDDGMPRPYIVLEPKDK